MPRRVGSRVDTDQSARPHKEVSDVIRVVREEIPRVFASLDTVHAAAAVRMDEASDKGLWMLDNEFLLPGGKADGPGMLRARAMLREGADPVLPVAVNLDATRACYVPGRPTTDVTDRHARPLQDAWVPRIEADAESPNASAAW